jgi:hypothetical protein
MDSERNYYEQMDEVARDIVYGYFCGNNKHDLTMLVINHYCSQQDLDEIVKDYVDNMREKEPDGLFPDAVIHYGP